MSHHIDLVPKWVRIIIGLLALANIAFGISGYFDASPLFQNNTAGIDFSSLAIKYAGYEYAARNLAIGLALMIVALKGVPESLTIVTIVRALIELQTVIIAVVTGSFKGGTVFAMMMFAVEIFVIVTLVKVIAKRDAVKSTEEPSS
ncbi:hypothetical protein BCD67_01560 [Oscillatoriales cyanobacterium USR001]|nr:hypothetical protein BCD67_01560 [Oscillatoriales cyanobacterium USR001]